MMQAHRRACSSVVGHRIARGAVASIVAATSLLFPPAASAAPAPRDASPEPGSAAVVGPFTFNTGPYELRSLPIEMLPYNGDSLVSSCGLTDASGVAMFSSGGVIYNHPVAQSRCALNMQRNYRLTGDQAYLDIAVANARRLLATSVAHDGGMFFPYPFTWNNPGRGRMVPPWYSAMAQGQALSVFVRLYEWTGDATWMQAANQAFASFKVPRQAGKPWVVGVENGLLWLDEYPTIPIDRVFNGHNFSMYGLYDYWRLTGSAEARVLALGALHSSYVAGADRIRVPGGISNYCSSDACIANQVRNPAYHVTHIGQLLTLFRITGHWHFASLAEAFIGDSPRPYAGSVELSAGRHDGYDFDSAGNGTLALSVTIPETVAAPYSRRDVPGGRNRPGNGIWMYVTHGALAGHWVRESSRAVPLGFTDELYFYRNRSVRVEAGTYIGSTFDASGASTGTVSAVAPAATWTYTRYSRINGRPSVLLTSGPLNGTWLALDTRTLRDSTAMTDIDSSIYRSDIIWLTTKGITRGCHTYAYCPSASVTREQMASFLVRALKLPATNRNFFGDDDGSQHHSDINRLAAAGVTAGCGPGRFCPRAPVTREQMASFLVRALDLPAVSTDYFADDRGSAHEEDINRLAGAGITGGCGESRFCPRDHVSRGQMAAFLHRSLTLPAAIGGAAAETPNPTTDGASPSPEPSATPSPTPSSSEADPTSTPTPVPTSTATPALTPSPEPTQSPEPTPSPTPTPVPSSPPSPTTTPTPGEPGG